MQPGLAILHDILQMTYAQMGDVEKSLAELKKTNQLDGDEATPAKVDEIYRLGGYPAVLEDRLRRLKERAKSEYVWPLHMAELAARCGRKEEAIQYLERAFTVHDPMVVRLQHEPDLDSLHSDPRYAAIVRKIGLPTLP